VLLGLNTYRFRDDLKSEAVALKIGADFEGGEASGVTGNPKLLYR